MGTLGVDEAQLFCRPRRPAASRLYHQRPRPNLALAEAHYCAGGEVVGFLDIFGDKQL